MKDKTLAPANSREERIAQLRAAIEAQEAMRPALGHATVELSLKPLRGMLESLLTDETASTDNDGTSGELLQRLQSYIPKQLADKIRTSGHIEGERRQVTVIFADISGFTALSERLDAEEVASFANDCMKELTAAVYHYEGMVDKFIGDCVMAVFGAPIALEDDAERALRASLAMRERLEAFNRRWIDKLKEPLSLHIGINSGTVIAGNVGNDLRMSYTVMGDTVNVASRLESAATRGQIFVSQSTHRLTHGAFNFKALEPIRVKGKKESLPIFELIGAKIQPEKARGLEGLVSPLMGRDNELAMLEKCLSAVDAGKGSIAFVYGEAGVGKTRLLADIRQHEAGNFTWLEGRCFAFSNALSYGPFLDLLRRHVGIADEQGEDAAQAALRSYTDKMFPGEADVYPVLAQLLVLHLSDADLEILKQVKGEAFRVRLFAIIEQLLLRLAEEKPVVILLEDLHWADHSSIELLSHLLPLTARGRVGIVGVSRSANEPAGNWEKLRPALEQHRERLTEVSLDPLSAESSRGLVEQLLGGNYLPEKLSEEILDKSGGNPFFLEEVLRSLIERGALTRSEQGWEVSALVETLRVPDTLQGVLLSRLDRLPEESKRVIQKAAVIGRVFFYRILEQMGGGQDQLDPQLSTLQEADLVRERSRVPEVEYIFKHALTQEVAYQTLLAPARKLLHRNVGEAMEKTFAERIEEFSGLLAYHYFCAESWEKALQRSVESADGAFRVCAYAEARSHYQRALECLERFEKDPPHLRQYIDITIKLVGASLQAESPEKNLARLLEAEAVAQTLDDPVRLGRVQLWIGRAHYYGGKLREAIGYFQKVLAVAPMLGDPELMALPGAVIGRVLFMQGQFQKSLQLLDQAIPLLEAANNRHEMLFAYIYRGASRTCLGDHSAGLSDLKSALKIARLSQDQNAEAMAHTGLALVQMFAGNYTAGMESARTALAVAEKSGDAMFRYSSNSFVAWALAGLGKFPESLKHWAAARDAAKPLGGRLLFRESFAAIEAETLLQAGNTNAALTQAEEALTLAKVAGSAIAEALAERALGRTLTAIPDRVGEALAHVSKSSTILEKIGAKYDLARTMLAQAKAEIACADPNSAAKTLEKAVSLARECNLAAEESAARTLLAELGKA
ncbi:MAG TPA: adenylate/guanylate cyclase domain-containing protein [Chthoniobacterales bacterium]|jgi:class 3 adenylate cyclase/tetratricopeptide (TPR) repeat protein|nr:adenylate/guanylate cyclase domain-containing protein [Chthoniobacterales bacterium]